MVKNKVTVIVMAIISFIVMPYAHNKGLPNLYGMWGTVETIKSSVMSLCLLIYPLILLTSVLKLFSRDSIGFW